MGKHPLEVGPGSYHHHWVVFCCFPFFKTTEINSKIKVEEFLEGVWEIAESLPTAGK